MAHFKEDIGGIYLQPVDGRDFWQDYEYHISVKETEIFVSVYRVPFEEDTVLIFEGKCDEEFTHWCEEGEG